MNKTIIVIALCVAFVSESFMFVYSRTLQRTADDLVKIHGNEKTEYQKAKECRDDGGKPVWSTNWEGKFDRCDFEKKS